MQFYSHGKILLSGEYTVLHGAWAMALPTQRGQSLTVHDSNHNTLEWISRNADGQTWFEGEFDLDTLNVRSANNRMVGQRLEHILQNVRQSNPDFCRQGTTAITELEFDRLWGLGSSSTLLSNLALWAQVDPYHLLNTTLGGSGYDIACAQAEGPLFYRKTLTGPEVQALTFDPPFKKDLYFIYLNQKQDSQKEVTQYQKKTIDISLLEEISRISQSLASCKTLETFQALLETHEQLMATHLNRPRIQEVLFSDYTGFVKSLGAWGGDFVLAFGGDNHYFKEKGYRVVEPYTRFIL